MPYYNLDYVKIRLDAEEKIPTLIKLCDNIAFLEKRVDILNECIDRAELVLGPDTVRKYMRNEF